MGLRGPAPRRDGERRRRNEPEGGPAEELGPNELKGLPFEVDLSPGPPDLAVLLATESDWHPLVTEVWNSMQRDPARKWMTSGDWAALAIHCESLSRELEEQIISVTKEGEVIRGKKPVMGATLSAFLKLLDHIGVTEAARLRLRKEVTLFPTHTAKIAAVADIGAAREEEVQ
jgi:hypothetical protein